MLGDWPVSPQAMDFPPWLATLDAALSGSSPDGLPRLDGRNAERFYRV